MSQAAAASRVAQRDVFFNCPFDDAYRPMFWAIIFTIHECGFFARSALEQNDGAQWRLSKINPLIRDCTLGIHDISRTESDGQTGLPRFNLPLELGLFLGAREFGSLLQRSKQCVGA